MIASQFCLGKSNQNRVRRNASFRCRPLPANRKKPWAAIIFRGLFFFNGPQDCCAVSPGYLVASIPCMRKLFGSCLFFSGPQEALRGLLCPGPLYPQSRLSLGLGIKAAREVEYGCMITPAGSFAKIAKSGPHPLLYNNVIFSDRSVAASFGLY